MKAQEEGNEQFEAVPESKGSSETILVEGFNRLMVGAMDKLHAPERIIGQEAVATFVRYVGKKLKKIDKA